MNDTEKLLEERGKQYGEFAIVACIAQTIKEVMFEYSAGPYITPAAEAIDLISTKMARISQNQWLINDWRDIAGYATLVVRELEKEGIE